MRPEYIEAVDAVRNGWSFWIIYILPALVIWISMFIRPFRPLRFRILFWSINKNAKHCTVKFIEENYVKRRCTSLGFLS